MDDGRDILEEFEEFLSVPAAGDEFLVVALELGYFEGFHSGENVPEHLGGLVFVEVVCSALYFGEFLNIVVV